MAQHHGGADPVHEPNMVLAASIRVGSPVSHDVATYLMTLTVLYDAMSHHIKYIVSLETDHFSRSLQA